LLAIFPAAWLYFCLPFGILLLLFFDYKVYSYFFYEKPFCSQRWQLNLSNFFKQGQGDLRPKRLPKKRYTEDQTGKSRHKFRAVLSQILPDKSLLQSATMSVYYFDGLQPVENPQCFLVLAWFGLWPAAGDLTPATLQNPEVARHT